MALGEAPLDPAGAVSPGNDRNPGRSFVHVDDHTARRTLLHPGQPTARVDGEGGRGAHPSTLNAHAQQVCRPTPPTAHLLLLSEILTPTDEVGVGGTGWPRVPHTNR